jgi:hypothetical protein
MSARTKRLMHTEEQNAWISTFLVPGLMTQAIVAIGVLTGGKDNYWDGALVPLSVALAFTVIFAVILVFRVTYLAGQRSKS